MLMRFGTNLVAIACLSGSIGLLGQVSSAAAEDAAIRVEAAGSEAQKSDAAVGGSGGSPVAQSAKPAEHGPSTETAASAPAGADVALTPTTGASPIATSSIEKPAAQQVAPAAETSPGAEAPARVVEATAPGSPTSVGAAPVTAAEAAALAAANEAAEKAAYNESVIAAVRTWFVGQKASTGITQDDVEAVAAFYTDRRDGVLWVERSGFNARARAAIDELRRADDYGLAASAFVIPTLAERGATIEGLAEAEAKLSLELLKYARFARGGRVSPTALSRIIDQVPPVKDPKVVLADLAKTEQPDAIMRGLHPKHAQFELLRQALLKAREPKKVAEVTTPTATEEKVRIPEGKTLKIGMDHPDVALLRKRLKVEARSTAKETFFDDELVEAVKSFQAEQGLKATGTVTKATRMVLNEGAAQSPTDRSDEERGPDTQRIILNMERWRWMPENLGDFYVWNNIPEFITRVHLGADEVFKERIIVGQPEWATPVFSADMQYVMFNPSWGMPDGIKARELMPRLKSAGGGFLFFGGGGGEVLRAYGLSAYRNGQQVNLDSIDWSSADLRQYSFVQPPGGKNPLGMVKFRFPNKFDVYMHDTIQRELFSQSSRALSHGCIRVQNPKQFAAVVLQHGNGLTEEAAERAVAGGGDITLKNPVPVHMTYFTVIADKSGKLAYFNDIYGHDGKLASALTGKSLRLQPAIEMSSSADVSDNDATTESGVASGKKKTASNAATGKKRKGVGSDASPLDIFADAFSN